VARLPTAETHYPDFGPPAERAAELMLRHGATGELRVALEIARGQKISRVAEVTARVDHGRWIGDCPFCPSAQLVSPSDPRFFCPDCKNDGRGFVKVVFPRQLESIEAALEKRPAAATRHWNQGETVRDLQLENSEHGVE
jgi:hypothetical protein